MGRCDLALCLHWISCVRTSLCCCCSSSAPGDVQTACNELRSLSASSTNPTRKNAVLIITFALQVYDDLCVLSRFAGGPCQRFRCDRFNVQLLCPASPTHALSPAGYVGLHQPNDVDQVSQGVTVVVYSASQQAWQGIWSVLLCTF